MGETMIERVARAIVDAEREFRGSEPMQQTEWRQYWSPGGPAAYPSLIAMRARAAVAAMREPTETMLMITDRALQAAPEDSTGIELASAIWAAMIDAALEEG